MLGIEIALMRHDYAAAERWEGALKRLSSNDDFDWRFYRACRLVAQFSKLDVQTRDDLQTVIESLRSDRPSWFPVVSLAGQYADFTGNRRQAIDAYQLSIELGDRRPQTFERLVAALYADGRYNDANGYLSQLAFEHPSDGKIESLGIALAIKENRLKEALDLAQKAVERGSSDPMHHVWLANLLSLDGQQKAAEDAFRESINRFPKDPRVWNGLFTYLVRTKQPDRARRALERWAKEVTSSESEMHFILAQGYEQLGDVAAAQEHYRTTIAKDASRIEARLRLAKMLLSSDVISARAQFEDVLRIDPENSEARRYIAALLAASGGSADWARAVELLEADGNSSVADEAGADDRLRAILLSRRGKNRAERLKNCEAARRILSGRLNRADGVAVDLDRLLLAGIYEQEAAMRDDVKLVQAARDAMRPLVDRDNPPVDYVAGYVQLLLRHLERSGADGEEALDEMDQRVVFIDDARRRIDKLEALLADQPGVERRFLPVSFRVRLRVADGRSEEGLQLLNEFANSELPNLTTDADRAKLLLQLGNLAAAAQFHQAAEGWYRQLVEIAPNSYILLAKSLVDQNKLTDAVDVCLQATKNRSQAEVATVLAQLLPSGSENTEMDRRVRPIIDSALDASGNDVDLLMSVAVLRVTEDDYDSAIRMFRKVVELQPNHALALNNLATLLAERPNQLAEARKYVEQAMSVSGRSPALLDTLGSILIRGGQYEQAVVTLEEAVAGAARDPRYFFHLAVAYDRVGRQEEAQATLATSRSYGLDRAILTSGDKELLASLQPEPLTATLPD